MTIKQPDKAVAKIVVEENCVFQCQPFIPNKDGTAPAPAKSILVISQAEYANASHYRDLLSKTGQCGEYPTGLPIFCE
jgi:hypothetical protein